MGGKQSQSLHAVMQIQRMLFDAGAWCCHGLGCVAYSLIPGPLASLAGSHQGAPGLTPGACVAGRGAAPPLNQLFPPSLQD